MWWWWCVKGSSSVSSFCSSVGTGLWFGGSASGQCPKSAAEKSFEPGVKRAGEEAILPEMAAAPVHPVDVPGIQLVRRYDVPLYPDSHRNAGQATFDGPFFCLRMRVCCIMVGGRKV